MKTGRTDRYNRNNNIKRTKKKQRTAILLAILVMLCLAAAVWLVLFGSQLRQTRAKDAATDNVSADEIRDIISNAAEEIPSLEPYINDWIRADHIYSHRGIAGANEHSFEAYDEVIEAGSHIIELDVVISGDGTLYVSHDLTAAAMTGDGRSYSNMTDEEIDGLRRYSGGNILKMSDVLEHYGEKVRYSIELKSGDAATIEAFKQTVEASGLEKRIDVQSFESSVLAELENIYPEMTKVKLVESQGALNNACGDPNVDEVCAKYPMMSFSNCEMVHEAGKRFSVWTIDSEGLIREAIALDIDAYFTNDTALAIELEKKYRKFKMPGHTTLLLASDYQAEAGFDSPYNNLNAVLDAADEDGKQPEMSIFCGDYSNVAGAANYNLSGEEYIAEIREAIRNHSPHMKDENMVFVQGNHDAKSESISESGLNEFDDCLVYVINTENDFPWKQGAVAGARDKVSRTADSMKQCFDDLIAKGETRPVIIAGHVPLHFTARTSSAHTTGDNLYSEMVFDVVNEAADKLDIIYLYGHNHSKGWDCYMGGAACYKGIGDSILLPSDNGGASTDTYEEKTLKFTYLNAGYVGYYINCAPDENKNDYSAADETLTCTICEIYPDRIEFARYDADGQHVLGANGEGNPYKGGVDASLIDSSKYSKETGSPVVIKRKAAGQSAKGSEETDEVDAADEAA